MHIDHVTADSLGAALKAAGLISQEMIARATAIQSDQCVTAVESYLQLGCLDQEGFIRFFHEQMGVPPADLSNTSIDLIAEYALPDVAVYRLAIPFDVDAEILRVAMADPTDSCTIQEIESRTALRVEASCSTVLEVRRVLSMPQWALGHRPDGSLRKNVKVTPLLLYKMGVNLDHGLDSDFCESAALSFLLLAAAAGQAQAALDMELKFVEGIGVRKSEAAALRWLLRAAHIGNTTAQFRLGKRYDSGEGVPLDYSEAARWFRMAAEQGHSASQYFLGCMCDCGVGVAQDYLEASKWFKKAAEQQNPVAQYNLGNMYFFGQGVSRDFSEAIKWYEKSADLGNADAQYKLANMYRSGEGVSKDPNKACKWFRMAAEHGHAPSQNSLGCIYHSGSGIPQNYLQAAKWILKAAKQNNTDAQYNLGLLYLYGRGVPQNHPEAIRWFERSAAQGQESAQMALGECYLEGSGVPCDLEEGARRYREIAFKGNASAQFKMGLLHLNGTGVKQDRRAALEWIRKAAEKGVVDAQAKLEELAREQLGSERNKGVPAKWFCQVAADWRDQVRERFQELVVASIDAAHPEPNETLPQSERLSGGMLLEIGPSNGVRQGQEIDEGSLNSPDCDEDPEDSLLSAAGSALEQDPVRTTDLEFREILEQLLCSEPFINSRSTELGEMFADLKYFRQVNAEELLTDIDELSANQIRELNLDLGFLHERIRKCENRKSSCRFIFGKLANEIAQFLSVETACHKISTDTTWRDSLEQVMEGVRKAIFKLDLSQSLSSVFAVSFEEMGLSFRLRENAGQLGLTLIELGGFPFRDNPENIGTLLVRGEFLRKDTGTQRQVKVDWFWAQIRKGLNRLFNGDEGALQQALVRDNPSETIRRELARRYCLVIQQLEIIVEYEIENNFRDHAAVLRASPILLGRLAGWAEQFVDRTEEAENAMPSREPPVWERAPVVNIFFDQGWVRGDNFDEFRCLDEETYRELYLEGYEPDMYSKSDQLLEDHGTRLHELLGKKLTGLHSVVVPCFYYNPPSNEYLENVRVGGYPLELTFGQIQFEVLLCNLGAIGISWNAIRGLNRPRWSYSGDAYDLSWFNHLSRSGIDRYEEGTDSFLSQQGGNGY